MAPVNKKINPIRKSRDCRPRWLDDHLVGGKTRKPRRKNGLKLRIHTKKSSGVAAAAAGRKGKVKWGKNGFIIFNYIQINVKLILHLCKQYLRRRKVTFAAASHASSSSGSTSSPPVQNVPISIRQMSVSVPRMEVRPLEDVPIEPVVVDIQQEGNGIGNYYYYPDRPDGPVVLYIGNDNHNHVEYVPMEPAVVEIQEEGNGTGEYCPDPDRREGPVVLLNGDDQNHVEYVDVHNLQMAVSDSDEEEKEGKLILYEMKS